MAASTSVLTDGGMTGGSTQVDSGSIQVRSLSSFKVSCQVFNELLESSLVSFLAGDFLDGYHQQRAWELSWGPSLTRTALLSFAESTEEPGSSQVKIAKI